MKPNRNYFACSVGEPGKDYVEDNFKRIITNKAFILHEDTIMKGVYEDINRGDILILKYNKHFVAYGEAIETKQTEDLEWNLWAPVKEWYFKDENNKAEGVTTYGIQWEVLEGAGQMGTVKGLSENFGIEKLKQINDSTFLYKEVIKEYIGRKKIETMEKIMQLLDYKKQIILQGPPGTGKTFQAKLMADQMTRPKNLGSPLQKIDKFFKSYDATLPENVFRRDELNNLLAEFQNKFPIDDIKDLTLEEYAVGTGSNDSFCWWIERGLKPLGYYFPGSARSYFLYWSKEKGDYSRHSKLLKEFEDNNEAMKKLASTLQDLISICYELTFPILGMIL